VFIDFENLQKIDADLIKAESKIIIFVGLNQENKSVDYTKELLTLKKVTSIELIKVNGRGHNALDFLLTFYLGNYIEKTYNCKIFICSKDTGYDPLIKHLNEKGISIQRIANQEENAKQRPVAKQKKEEKTIEKNVGKNDDDYKKVIKYLEDKKDRRPSTVKALTSDLSHHFAKTIQINKIEKIINLIIQKKQIEIIGNKIEYKI
jgi:hypothetical protein